MKTNAATLLNEMTPAEIAEMEMSLAAQYVEGAREMIASKSLVIKGVQIKAIHRANYRSIFNADIAPLVRRYMGWPAITC